MQALRKSIELFFEAYASRFQDALKGKEVDVDGTVNSFTGCFIEASPLGTTCSKNDDKFRESIPRGYEFYKSIGTRSMKIDHKEITVLDDYHAMVTIHWASEYRKNDNGLIKINFDVIYFVQLRENNLKIFAYITGDEQKVLKQYGLIPA